MLLNKQINKLNTVSDDYYKSLTDNIKKLDGSAPPKKFKPPKNNNYKKSFEFKTCYSYATLWYIGLNTINYSLMFWLFFYVGSIIFLSYIIKKEKVKKTRVCLKIC